MPGSIYTRHLPSGPAPTVGDHLDAGYKRVMLWCNKCQNNKSISVERMDRSMTFEDVRRRAVCSHCCNRETITIQRDAEEFYQDYYEKTGFSLGSAKLPKK